jgi:hypothetical protein
MEIPLTHNKVTIIDTEDYPLICRHSWSASLTSYGTYRAETRINNKIVRLHRLLLNAPPGLVVDHINHDTLDNRRCNLRLTTQSCNLRNRADQTPDCGLVLRPSGHWQCRVSEHNRTVWLGTYDTKEEARRVRTERLWQGRYVSTSRQREV